MWNAGIMSESDDEAWYYCLEHGTTERGKVCGSRDRMGPYPDQATAARALDIARERNKAADAYDEE